MLGRDNVVADESFVDKRKKPTCLGYSVNETSCPKYFVYNRISMDPTVSLDFITVSIEICVLLTSFIALNLHCKNITHMDRVIKNSFELNKFHYI